MTSSNMELRKIARNGHSYQVTLPRKYLAALKLAPRDVVQLELLDDGIVLWKPAARAGVRTVAGMLARSARG